MVKSFLVFCICFIAFSLFNCQTIQNKNKSVNTNLNNNPNTNYHLDKDIKLNNNIKVIIDSTFEYSSGSKMLQIVEVYYLNNSILDSTIYT